MNQAQRDKLTKLKETLEGLRHDFNEVKEEIEEGFSNLTEEEQDSPNGEKISTELNTLDDLDSNLASAFEDCESALS